MNNIENILKIIIQNAEEKANQIKLDTEKEYNEKYKQIENSVNEEYLKNKKVIDDKFLDTVSKSEKTANLEKTKIDLAFRQDVLNEIFDEVLKNLCNLEQHKYEKLIENLLVHYAKEEDAISLSEDTKVDEKFITSLSVFKKRKLKYIIGKSPIKGGFILKNSVCDTIVSFESIVDELKEKYAYKISKELFK